MEQHGQARAWQTCTNLAYRPTPKAECYNSLLRLGSRLFRSRRNSLSKIMSTYRWAKFLPLSRAPSFAIHVELLCLVKKVDQEIRSITKSESSLWRNTTLSLSKYHREFSPVQSRVSTT